MITLLSITAAWFLADFYTGVFHWIEDRYVAPGNSLDFLIGKGSGESLHHDKPTAMLLNTRWENIRSAAYPAWIIALVAWFVGLPMWFVLSLVFVAFGNLVHRFAHTPIRQLSPFTRFMQRTGLFISHDHHDTHHREDGELVRKQHASRAYCGMTDWVNPIVDSHGLWAKLEFSLSLLGIHPVDQRKES
jgi:hypothetical protein